MIQAQIKFGYRWNLGRWNNFSYEEILCLGRMFCVVLHSLGFDLNHPLDILRSQNVAHWRKPARGCVFFFKYLLHIILIKPRFW